MKKTKLKKAVAIIAATTLCMGGGVSAFAESRILPNEEFIVPYNIAIAFYDLNLSVGGDGKLVCYGETMVRSGYTSGIVVELQKDDGGWDFVTNWRDSGGVLSTVDKTWTGQAGYSYRLKVTFNAYDSNGNLVETFVEYSDTVRC